MPDAGPTRRDVRLTRCARLMEALERELRRSRLWESQPPPPEAFQSVMPFITDRMSFGQWLQWVFIPHTRALLDHGGPLPESSAIRPMAEEMFKDVAQDTDVVVELIGEFDRLVNGGR